MPRRSPLVAVAALLALTACGGGGNEPRPSDALGDDAFAGEATLIDGSGTVELSAFEDEDLVVWFWSPWCTSCRREGPAVAEVDSRFGDEVAFLGIGAAGSTDDMQAFLDDTGTGSFPQVIDDDGSLWLQFGAEIRSSFLFVDDDGTVQRTGFGEMTEERLAETVEALAAP